MFDLPAWTAPGARLGPWWRRGPGGGWGGWRMGPGPDPATQLFTTLGESLVEGLENLLTMVDQSTSLMRPMSAPMAPGGPWRRGRARRGRGWDQEGGPRRWSDCGCGGAPGRWHDPVEEGCGCGGGHDHHEHRDHHEQITTTTRGTTSTSITSGAAAVTTTVSPTVAAVKGPGTAGVVGSAAATVIACVVSRAPTSSSRPVWASVGWLPSRSSTNGGGSAT